MLCYILALSTLQTLKDTVAKTQDSKPLSYHCVCEYLTMDTKGTLLAKKRIQANYWVDKTLKWTDVSVAEASGDRPYGAETPQAFMNGLTYEPSQVKNDDKEGFFAKIPSQNVECRNLIWDAHMFEGFAYDHLDAMKLNEPVSISKDKDSSLGDAGNFHDHNTKLTWIGEGESHGTKCVLIRYESFFNTFTYKMGTIAVTGTSEYWGDIWLSKRTKRIENANLNESVTVLIGDAKVPFRSFRLLTFEAKRDKG